MGTMIIKKLIWHMRAMTSLETKRREGFQKEGKYVSSILVEADIKRKLNEWKRRCGASYSFQSGT
jgi:hypothetical protein